MDSEGRPDDTDVKAKIRECLDLGLADVRICGTEDTVVGSVGTDPVNGAQYRLVITNGTLAALTPPFGWDNDEFAFHEWGDDEDTLTFDVLMKLAGDENFWKSAVAALLDLQATARAAIAARVPDFENEQRERLNSLNANPSSLANDPSLNPPDEDAAFSAFKAACDQRRKSSEFFSIALPPEPDNYAPFHLRFGHRPGQPNQEVFYEINSRMSVVEIYLNGLVTTPDRYEEDIRSHCTDPWERLGLLRVAQDLIAIKQAAYDLVYANAASVRQAAERDAAERRLEEFVVGLRALENAEVEMLELGDPWDTEEAARLAVAREALDDRVKALFGGDST